MMNDEILREHEVCNHRSGLKCMPWGGILTGALVAVGLSFLLSIFGAAIGLSAFRTSPEGVTSLAIGGYIGMLIGTIAVMFLAGWVAGFLGRTHCFHRNLGALYGFTAWCLSLLIMVVIAMQTIQFISVNLYSITNRKVTTARLYNDAAAHMANEPRTANSTNNDLDRTNPNDAEATKLLARSLFLTFTLFFIGAISSALGGYCGVKPCEEYCCSNKMVCSKP